MTPFIFKAKGTEVLKPAHCPKLTAARSAYVSSKTIKLPKKTQMVLGNYPVKYQDSSPVPKKLRVFSNVLNTETLVKSKESSEIQLNQLCPNPSKKENLMCKMPVSRRIYDPLSTEFGKLKIFSEKVDDGCIETKKKLVKEKPTVSSNDSAAKVEPVEKTNSRLQRKIIPDSKKTIGQGAVTIVKPFSFDSRKRKWDDTKPQKFVSMAEIIRKFEESRGCNFLKSTNSNTFKASYHSEYRCTSPRAPKLRTKERRCRPSCTCALKEQNRHQDAGKINQAKSKPLFKFDTNPKSKDMAYKLIFNEVEKENVTPSKSKSEHKETCPRMLASAVKVTKPQPFSFFDRDLKRYALRDERLEKEREFALKFPVFEAQPLPSPTEFGIPEKKIKPLTHQEPFNLLGEYQRQLKLKKFQKEVEEKLKLESEAMKFHAQPCHIIHKPPFEPVKSDKPSTETMNIHLFTEDRAKDRLEFDLNVRRNDEEIEEATRIREKWRMEKIRLEEIQIRKLLIHKANPIIEYPPIIIKSNPKPPTVPISPSFGSH